ncbi:hypothetical protein PCH70_32340 [Pseudomonas cichorii JBC1]|nr:hypothetical protein PCH70_32340 [Pseudomonas cichorii JBC1]
MVAIVIHRSCRQVKENARLTTYNGLALICLLEVDLRG